MQFGLYRLQMVREAILTTRRWLPVLLLALAPATAHGDYYVYDLGVITGGNSSHGQALNGAGMVTGNGSTGSSTHAFVTSPGNTSLADLGTLGGASHGLSINDGGVIVGDSDLAGGHTHAFVATGPGSMMDLGVLSNWTSDFATGVNNANQVVGYALLMNGTNRAFIGTTQGNFQELGTLGGPNSFAYGINANGVVVGAADVSLSQTHAFTAVGTTLTDLGGLGGSGLSYGMAINNFGVVVGFGGFLGSSHAFRSTSGGTLQDLGTLAGGLGTSFAYGVNNGGDTVGTSSTSFSGSHAFLVKGASSTMLDLNGLLLNGAGWTLTEADGINGAGQIVGTGVINGATHAFLLNPGGPVPEPSASILLMIGGAGLVVVFRRKRLAGRGHREHL